jgi:hypothetical protein
MLWVGFMVYMVAFLMPALQTVGPAAGQVMAALQRRRLMAFMPGVALLTLLSGLRLYWIMSDGFSPAYVHSRMGMTFGIAGLLAITAFVLGMTVTRPAMARMSALGAQLPTAGEAERPALQAEMARLRERGRRGSLGIVTLVLLAAVGMAVARYV